MGLALEGEEEGEGTRMGLHFSEVFLFRYLTNADWSPKPVDILGGGDRRFII